MASRLAAGALGLILIVVGCSSEPQPSAPAPVIGEARDDSFALQIAAERDHYRAGDSIGVSTQVSYLGPKPELVVGHASSLVMVSLEQLDGPFEAGGGSDLVCVRSTMRPGVPVAASYQKSGGFSADDPLAAQYRAFFADPVLRLPPGTYRFTATIELFENDCGATGIPHDISAAITIAVTP